MTSASAGPRPTDSERMKTGEKPQTAMVNSMARRATGGPARTDQLQDCGDLGGGLDHALLGEELLQLARLEHLGDDIAAADELALDEQLRNGRPVGIFLDALAQRFGFED